MSYVVTRLIFAFFPISETTLVPISKFARYTFASFSVRPRDWRIFESMI